MYKSIVITLCLSAVMLRALPQNIPVKQINVLGKSKTNSLWLRWAPANHTLWQLGNTYGYTINRFTLRPDGELESNIPQKLSPVPLKPLGENEMETLSQKVEEVSVIQELIYGGQAKKTFIPGNLSSVINRNREMENSFGIALLVCDLSPETARAAGLFFEDKTAEVGKRYIYQVSLAQQHAGMDVKPGIVVLEHTREKPLGVVKDMQAIFGNRAVTLSWPTLFHKGIFSAYYIEKSPDGKKFNRTTDLPYVHMSEKLETETAYYKDSLDVNNKIFYYRIIGITPFGELSNPSTVVSGQGVDNLNGLLILREARVLENNKVTITWEFPVGAEKKISGYILSRAHNPEGPFADVTKKIIPPYKRDYIDETPFNNTYYQVKAISQSGIEVGKSFAYHVHLEDNTPPAPPTGLSGVIDKMGIVNIKWSANTEKDIMGYRVFVTNSLKLEQVEVTKYFLPAARFIDTINLKVLNKKVYYTVVAVDKTYNISEYSTPLTLMRPDVIAPAPPVFSKTDFDANGIILAWINSVSDDVAKYELLRKSTVDSTLTKILTVQDNKSSYQDIAVTLGHTYTYTLKVYDSTGNSSQTTSKAIYFETGIRDAITGFKARINRDTKSINLLWDGEGRAVKYILYRRKNDDVFRVYQTLEAGESIFNDTDIKISNVYAYKIQAIYPAGIKSHVSGELVVTF